jgi:eukaryotic-like serine/threonine-protein kinase
LYSLNPKNGSIAWRYSTNDLIEYDPCGDGKSLYFGSNDGNFYKLDLKGNLLWKFTSGNRFWGDCKLYNDVVITTSWDTHCYGLDRATGVPKWKVSSDEYNYGGADITGGTVIFASHYVLFTIKADNGKVLSKTKTGYLHYAIPFQGFIWTTDDGNLNKRTMDGKLLTGIKFNAAPEFRPVTSNNFLIIGDTTNGLNAISTDLKTIWKYKAKDAFWAPGVLHNGIYYTGNRDAHVYALKIPQ